MGYAIVYMLLDVQISRKASFNQTIHKHDYNAEALQSSTADTGMSQRHGRGYDDLFSTAPGSRTLMPMSRSAFTPNNVAPLRPAWPCSILGGNRVEDLVLLGLSYEVLDGTLNAKVFEAICGRNNCTMKQRPHDHE